MKNAVILSLLALLLSFCTNNKASDRLSNGLIEIVFNIETGSYDIRDLRKNQIIISEATIAFAVKPYLELGDLGSEEVETDQVLSYFSSAAAQNSISTSSQLNEAFPGGESISFISKIDGKGELELQFTLYPDSTFVEMGFSFKNLGAEPVRLGRIEVVNGLFLPGSERNNIMTLNGDSGGNKTEVLKGVDRHAENNILCFFADTVKQQSLVAGGLTYNDYRKYIDLSRDSIIVFASDPVGKRVDAGAAYLSADRFYLEGSGDNPFVALESYAEISRKARNIDLNYYTFPSTCMWFLSVTHFGADATAENSSVGAVEEMKNIIKSGFLKYAPVAVRLVPDNYEQNNQQGWWDDEHWQIHGRKYRCVVDHHYKEPYETTEKWAGKIRELGGIPLTYFQPGIRSEDYAEAYPGHMLYNEARKYILKDGEKVSDPHVLMGSRGVPDLLNPGQWINGYGKMWAEAYDYTDPEFLSHWIEVNKNLSDGGVQGVFYDYPDRAFPQRGGLEDRYATALEAYRNVFAYAREELGPEAYQQERLGIGSDATLGLVSSVRTEGDNNVITPKSVTKASVRWYKNRRLVSYDLDGKALVEAGHGPNRYELSTLQRQAILTLSYTVSGRLLLTESFNRFSPEVIYDLSRVYPFHASSLSARPLDAFVNENASVFDFIISPEWHQLVLYNPGEENREMEVALSGNTAFGAMGLDFEGSYYMYDFWNDSYIGRYDGSSKLKQELSSGEARMISVHEVEDHPQWISTDRHIMQGYVDLIKKPEWDREAGTLTGVSSVIGGETYRITIALNGYIPLKVNVNGAKAEIMQREENDLLVDIILLADESQELSWELIFRKEN